MQFGMSTSRGVHKSSRSLALPQLLQHLSPFESTAPTWFDFDHELPIYTAKFLEGDRQIASNTAIRTKQEYE